MPSDKNRLVVQSKAVGPKWEREFFLELQKAILDGYRIAENDLREDASMRNFRGRFGRAVLYKEVAETQPKKEAQPEAEVAEEKAPAPKKRGRAAKPAE